MIDAWRAARATWWGELLLDRFAPAYFFTFVAWGRAVSLTRLVSEPDEAIGGFQRLAAIAHQASGLAFIILVIVLFALRRSVRGPRATTTGAIVALAGTFALTVVAGAPPTISDPALLLVAAGLSLAGTLWAGLSLAVLGTCFGIFPEARGLVTRGPYRLVRHPIYLGEMVAGLGLVLPILSPATGLAWLAFVGLQTWRAINEEQALLAVFPEYERYRARTRRLVPFLW